MGIDLKIVLMKLILFITLLAATATLAAARAKPGCRSLCGDVTIPYPFGTGNHCNISEQFFITCNTTFTPNKAFLITSNLEVVDISLDGQLTILGPVSYDCYPETPRSSFNYWLSIARFPVNNTRNKFTAIGCDIYASLLGAKKRSPAGCLSLCDNISDVINGSCSGIGCCQMAIPKGLRGYNITLDSYQNHSNVLPDNPCSYAFVAEESAYNFSVSDLLGHRLRNKEFPVILDWTIGNKNCSEAKKDKNSFACKENSNCVDSENGGYICKCFDGYEGTPYISDGCQDINECETLSPCSVDATCQNFAGSYNCSCLEGFRGDGWKNGTGCDHFIIREKSTSSNINIILVICTSIWPLVVLLGTWRVYKVLVRRTNIRLKQKYFKRNGGLLLQQQLSANEGNVEKTRLFTSKELEKATDYYNENRILGQGGQGTVYKGMLTDGSIVAIKMPKMVEETILDEKMLQQFINEVIILSRIDHRNVVQLLGCCLETEVPLLVYEFVPNGTLSQLIHDQNEEFPLTWEMRFRIAVESADALSYLHSAASIPIYHRDIKSSNILLDDKYRAKVSDFGISRSIALEKTHLTTGVQGTFGYMDPEYFWSSQFTMKSDVYSFGVVLLELLTGQKPILIQSEEVRSLASFFLLSMKENSLFDILDPRAVKNGPQEEIMAVAKLAKRCLNLNGKRRPTMKQVAMELQWIRSSEEANAVDLSDDEDFDIDDMIEPCDMVSCSGKGNLHAEEAKYLVGELCNTYGGGASSTSMGYDSINNKVTFELEGER